jgi:RND superfamily putative drug exporter
LLFAIAMDYTVFLLSAAKEHWDHTHDPHQAMVGGLAHSGRVIFAAAAVMVAVFFTFALSGPLPPKEIGVISASPSCSTPPWSDCCSSRCCCG